ncbi:hypothetical protein DFH01_19470 [Falsiroseomonas bella]|uniref:Uncharacterized protein n=1 Tax=Falsiroseomonas bella TaxID=2184016 RepID=A0A317F9D9_9PROT|nr:hypothetical protein [Falsiroseomonas bella]PWS35760.1 hypothetical protein DFH01_19470 [Falsiroseomonas bella]
MRQAAAALLLATLPAGGPLAQGSVAQGPPWTERLVELAPAMRACLEGQPPEAMVVLAWPMNRGLAMSRLLLPGGARQDCVADLGTGRVERRDPVAPDQRMPGEGIQSFMLDRRCVDARRIEDSAGKVLGWLAYPACG